jgi:hypothetical protein
MWECSPPRAQLRKRGPSFPPLWYPRFPTRSPGFPTTVPRFSPESPAFFPAQSPRLPGYIPFLPTRTGEVLLAKVKVKSSIAISTAIVSGWCARSTSAPTTVVGGSSGNQNRKHKPPPEDVGDRSVGRPNSPRTFPLMSRVPCSPHSKIPGSPPMPRFPSRRAAPYFDGSTVPLLSHLAGEVVHISAR